MTFAAYEQSNATARPVGLYSFIWGNTRWDYCTAALRSGETLTFDGVAYSPAAITETSVKQGGDNVPEFTLTVPAALPVVALFRGTPPSTRVRMEVKSVHPDDPDQEVVVRWTGPVSNVQPKDAASADIVSRVTGLKRAGARETYGRGCSYFLFGPGCGVDKAGFANARTVTAISGNLVTLDDVSPSANYFNRGFIEWDADGSGTLEARTIETEVSPGVYQLMGRGDGITVGLAVNAYPGCAHNTTDCDTIFDNLANYPGLDFMMEDNPFDQRALI